MTDAFSALPFSDYDLQLLTIDEVSIHLGTSRAFVRLCVDTGCRTRGGRLSAAELLHWLFEHYAEVRQCAGLAPLCPIAALQDAARRQCKMANAVITLTQFNASRSSMLCKKRHFRGIIQMMQRAMGGF
ncbi:MAG: hypothetical protein JWL90_998 [Chthoniobacteraceae bacterium]|nr:hypothetical protein [Chthoniobacteraceae bacterium]